MNAFELVFWRIAEITGTTEAALLLLVGVPVLVSAILTVFTGYKKEK